MHAIAVPAIPAQAIAAQGQDCTGHGYVAGRARAGRRRRQGGGDPLRPPRDYRRRRTPAKKAAAGGRRRRRRAAGKRRKCVYTYYHGLHIASWFIYSIMVYIQWVYT